jgi:hypothetical protein
MTSRTSNRTGPGSVKGSRPRRLVVRGSVLPRGRRTSRTAPPGRRGDRRPSGASRPAERRHGGSSPTGPALGRHKQAQSSSSCAKRPQTVCGAPPPVSGRPRETRSRPDTPHALRVCPIRGDESMHLDTDPGLHGYPTNRRLPRSPTRAGTSASSSAGARPGSSGPCTGP